MRKFQKAEVVKLQQHPAAPGLSAVRSGLYVPLPEAVIETGTGNVEDYVIFRYELKFS